jgi:hypothetical protein
VEKDDIKEGIVVRHVVTILLFANDIDVAVLYVCLVVPICRSDSCYLHQSPSSRKIYLR